MFVFFGRYPTVRSTLTLSLSIPGFSDVSRYHIHIVWMMRSTKPLEHGSVFIVLSCQNFNTPCDRKNHFKHCATAPSHDSFFYEVIYVHKQLLFCLDGGCKLKHVHSFLPVGKSPFSLSKQLNYEVRNKIVNFWHRVTSTVLNKSRHFNVQARAIRQPCNT